jgi:hypothetical protein
MDWIQQYSSAINALCTTVLVFVTGWYVVLTKKILNVSERQSKLSLNPVIGIEIGKMTIGKVFGPDRRSLGIPLELTNVGNAPAIEVLVDAEIILYHSTIEGEDTIPSRFDPDMISFIKPGETKNECHISFGNTLVAAFLDNVREAHRLNIHRIETDPTRESYKTSKLRVTVYYRNSVDQYFKSFFEAEIGIHVMGDKDPIPKSDETAKVSIRYIPRPKFHAQPITSDEMTSDFAARAPKRDLCGW